MSTFPARRRVSRLHGPVCWTPCSTGSRGSLEKMTGRSYLGGKHVPNRFVTPIFLGSLVFRGGPSSAQTGKTRSMFARRTGQTDPFGVVDISSATAKSGAVIVSRYFEWPGRRGTFVDSSGSTSTAPCRAIRPGRRKHCRRGLPLSLIHI